METELEGTWRGRRDKEGGREGGREEWKMEGEKNRRREKESRMCVLGEKGREGLTF